jgi:hypothetical protein
VTETRWICIFNTEYNDECVVSRVRELLQYAKATSIRVEKWDEQTIAKLQSQVDALESTSHEEAKPE